MTRILIFLEKKINNFFVSAADELEKYFLLNFKRIQSDIGFSYGDSHGLVKFQKGVYRINCVDCLDRTNVVQRWLAESVVKDEMVRIGCLLPEDNVPLRLKTALKNMWHENGNTISRQYTGTDALKGDVTKTGKREMTGFLRDGVNSLERRYVMAQFRDSILQCVIDLLTLGYSDEPGFSIESQIVEVAKKRIDQTDEFWSAWIVDHMESHVELSSQNPRNRLFPVAWTLSKGSEDIVTFHVLMVCSNNFYLVYVQNRLEKLKVVKCFKVPIRDLESLAFGTILNSGSEVCCLQIFHPIPTTASGITTTNQITLKPVDLDEATLGNPVPKSSDTETGDMKPSNSDEDLQMQLTNPENCSDEYSKSRATVDKIVEDFAKARSRLSLSIKVKSGQLEVASAEHLSMINPSRKMSAQNAADKLKGFLTAGVNRTESNIERTRSSEDVQMQSDSRSYSQNTNSMFMKSSQFLNRIKPKEFLGRFQNGNSNSNSNANDETDSFNRMSQSGLRRQSISDSNLSSNDSILNIELANSSITDTNDTTSTRDSQENIGPYKMSTVKVENELATNGAKLQVVEVQEYVSVQHDQKTLVKRLQSKDCKTMVCFL